MPGRTIAVGDIHGCSLALDALLAAVRPRPEDTIVTLGDSIDRGPDSKGVIDRLIDLDRRCRLIPLLGNHEEMQFDARDSGDLTVFLAVGGDATLDSYGPGRDLDLIPEEHLEFLGGCLDYFETDAHIFVHANYLPDLPMDDQPADVLLCGSSPCLFATCGAAGGLQGRPEGNVTGPGGHATDGPNGRLRANSQRVEFTAVDKPLGRRGGHTPGCLVCVPVEPTADRLPVGVCQNAGVEVRGALTPGSGFRSGRRA
jgi:hypothetical protein